MIALAIPSIAPTSKQIRFHPLVEQFPPPAEAELAALADSIRRRAIRFATIDTDTQGRIVDNRARTLACVSLGVELKFRECDRRCNLPRFIAEANVPRNLLEESQRAAIAVPFAEAIATEGRERQQAGLRRGMRAGDRHDDANGERGGRFASKSPIAKNPPVSADLRSREKAEASDKSAQTAADLLHVSCRSVELAQEIFRGDKSLFEQIRLGKINLNQARQKLAKYTRAASAERTVHCDPIKAHKDMVRCGDFPKIAPTLPRQKHRLIIWDPPYNSRRDLYEDDPTRDNLPDDKYFTLIKRCLHELAQLLTPDGSIFTVINDDYRDHFGVFMRHVRGFPLHRRRTINWVETFAQNQKSNFTSEVRAIHYFTRSKKNFVWNGDDVLIPTDREKLYNDARGDPAGKVPGSFWIIPRVTGNGKDAYWFEKKTPQLPTLLIERIVKVASDPGDLVLDPMCGCGHVGRVALSLGRNFLGIERSPLYARNAVEWISAGPINREGAKSAKG